jgi:hypothetical protein
LSKLKTHVAYFLGGPKDMAQRNVSARTQYDEIS